MTCLSQPVCGGNQGLVLREANLINKRMGRPAHDTHRGHRQVDERAARRKHKYVRASEASALVEADRAQSRRRNRLVGLDEAHNG
ncbi:hypothetical protein BCR44DRAFT_1438988 [Catenaria anguillulae PL171]|uniref:Uncharacterized protein n=1 Tax=Catenaria anguillulae PL171 TaxID=765915 RepID=A0A1Y2HER8_9FUNG|nr:hypothetical protein BCR44DRAFT_1438988 [Catenaria anguillulae PL171]